MCAYSLLPFRPNSGWGSKEALDHREDDFMMLTIVIWSTFKEIKPFPNIVNYEVDIFLFLNLQFLIILHSDQLQ